MVSYLTIALFFIYTYGLGFSVTYWLKKPANFLERTIMNIGFGLGVFSILGIILNTLSIPLDWKIFLILSLIIPAYHLYKKGFTKPQIKLTKSNITIFIALAIFAVSFFMYASGSFAYPYLEDEDPWGHAVGIKYVSLEKNAFDPTFQNSEEIDQVLSYIDPYPPAYNIILGVLHQTSDNLRWTIKFFNSLIISLGLLFFFFFSRRFFNNSNKALLATFFLAAIPAYLSHFIWAHSLVITLFFPAMYAYLIINKDKNWWYLAAIMTAAIWVSQNLSQPIKLTTMIAIYLIIHSIAHNKFFTKGFLALFSGMALSFFWWGAILNKYGWTKFVAVWEPSLAVATASTAATTTSTFFSKISLIITAITNPGGTGSRAYTFSDFFYAKSQNMINNPIGIGIFISILVILGVIYLLWKHQKTIVNKEHYLSAVALFWLIFTFWGVNGMTFPISIARGSFRVWMLLAIAIALVAPAGVSFIQSFLKSKHLRMVALIIIIIGVSITSFQYKYDHNTVIWPTSSAFAANPQQAFEYAAWLDTQPEDTRIFMYSRNKIIVGFGKYNCLWCEDEIIFREQVETKTPQEIHTFLKQRDYKYLLLSPRIDKKHFKRESGSDNLDQRLQQHYDALLNSGLFLPVYQKEGLFIALQLK